MNWKPIVAGVDPTVEGTRAAVAAVALARQAGTTCHLIHAVRDPWVDVTQAEFPMNVTELNQQLFETAETRVRAMLESAVPSPVLRDLKIRMGAPVAVLENAVEDYDPELLVLGGKHHSTLGRWLAGSTAHIMVRRANVPLLVTGQWSGAIDRIVAAVDLSSAAGPTITAAERMAGLFNAKLTVVHVVEPMPVVDGVTVTITETELLERANTELTRTVWPLISRAGTDRLVREGIATDVIPRVVREQKADLVVVGSHGRGWVDRLLIGSATERLLNQLPCSMLIVPVFNPARQTARDKRRSGRHGQLAASGGVII